MAQVVGREQLTEKERLVDVTLVGGPGSVALGGLLTSGGEMLAAGPPAVVLLLWVREP